MNVVAMDETRGWDDAEARLAAIQRYNEEQAKIAEEVARQKARGGVELDARGKPEVPVTLSDVGIVNRRTARAAGLRNPRKHRGMAVPKARKKRRNRR